MNVLEIRDVVKQYHNHIANNKVSFNVEEGKLFGLLGPNGAGKTTLIRIITHITKADAGSVLLHGKPVGEWVSKEIGYMPEERGLYKKMKVAEQLLYLGQLRGMSRSDAVKKIKYWFEKFDIGSWEKKQIDELSKGMQQKIQFIATVLHEPRLLILDEPFSGLDPVNSKLIEDEIKDLSKSGVTILFSTHRMEQVEEICEDIVLINQGRAVLNGNVDEIKQTYKENKFVVKYDGASPDLNQLQNDLAVLDQSKNSFTYLLQEGITPNQALAKLLKHNVNISSYEELLPSLSDIFIKTVKEDK